MSCSLAVSCVFIAPNQTNKCGSCGTCSRIPRPLATFPLPGWRAKNYATQCAQIAQSNYQQQQQQQGYPLLCLPLPQVELRQSIIMLACNRNNCSPKGGLGDEGGCHWGLTLQKSLLEPGLSPVVVVVVVSLSTGQPFGVKDERVTTTAAGAGGGRGEGGG